ncbi:Uncharacterized protein TPAR_01944 [Tolypocladium paradoxum]|uniref:Uncharacterized protein n=1 Tax=Tolypocladium paradoxum TaxID=94208 RepID=A0A2S4L5X8_9HYPO|nr:Uncharacterized protein TPAR_01944 [Tolypocladium paradoxum]
MGTPFITLLEPSKLEGFQAGVPHDAQPASIPRPFLDAMEVRESVFVEEQKVPLENEFDADDPRSCHWVVYASVNKTEELEVRDEDGNVIQPRKSSTRTTPIGTIRLVPFPHDQHPKAGGTYWNGVLEGDDEKSPSSPGGPNKTVGTDRPTSFHDGKEPYVKLGRLSVVKEFRGNNLAGLLVSTVLSWLRENPAYFDPSITELGLESMGATNETEIPKWGGLVCVHAQEQVVGAWSKWGFRVDEGMGRWWEEDIPHVGMFQRLQVSPKEVRI